MALVIPTKFSFQGINPVYPPTNFVFCGSSHQIFNYGQISRNIGFTVESRLKCKHEKLFFQLRAREYIARRLICRIRMYNQIPRSQKLLFGLLGCVVLVCTLSSALTRTFNLEANAVDRSEQQTAGNHLDRVKERGYLICGVNGELPGFSFVNAEGQYEGIDVDLCRAVAAAIFDDPNLVRFRDLSAAERFDVLKSGEIDILSRNTTLTLSRDADEGLEFTPPIFYDAQGMLVKDDGKIEKLSQLANKAICVTEDTTSYDNLQDYLTQTQIKAKIIASDDSDVLFNAYEHDRCQAITADVSQLVTRKTLLANPEDHLILNETISQEPLAPALVHRDSQWFDIVKWVTFALIQAEELNITSDNFNLYDRSRDTSIRRFLGLEGSLGRDMGLSNDFARRIIEHVGNYGEIYNRNLTQPFGLERNRNALWTNGGLMYSPPFN